MDADPRLDAVWHVEECSDEHAEFCPCIITTGEGNHVDYVADAETPELASRIAADHNEAADLRAQLAERDAQIAGLLADEVDLSDDQAGVPA
ncbi:hypothetical protein ACWGDE_01480 [Streptomyces sp. NPDC054956]